MDGWLCTELIHLIEKKKTMLSSISGGFLSYTATDIPKLKFPENSWDFSISWEKSWAPFFGPEIPENQENSWEVEALRQYAS